MLGDNPISLVHPAQPDRSGGKALTKKFGHPQFGRFRVCRTLRSAPEIGTRSERNTNIERCLP
ncbi:hypothetical protein C7H75_00700 [Prescottella equi]|nr:hypothetical protein C7H75_00700 [Prescottella equi]